jgi:hypothetical protein
LPGKTSGGAVSAGILGQDPEAGTPAPLWMEPIWVCDR